jgi:hypothetical protein
MFNHIVGTRCILQEPGGKEMEFRLTSAMLRQCTGCVPEIDLTCEPFAHEVVIEPPEFRYAFRHDAKYKAKQVIFNPPATVVLWADGTKTVVKCDPEDTYSETTGVALCYMKKALGNTSRELNKALRKARRV